MKDLLIRAREEIRQLRRRNEILAAKVEMIDLFACVLHTRPAAHAGGETVDVAWLLDQRIGEIDQAARVKAMTATAKAPVRRKPHTKVA